MCLKMDYYFFMTNCREIFECLLITKKIADKPFKNYISIANIPTLQTVKPPTPVQSSSQCCLCLPIDHHTSLMQGGGENNGVEIQLVDLKE